MYEDFCDENPHHPFPDPRIPIQVFTGDRGETMAEETSIAPSKKSVYHRDQMVIQFKGLRSIFRVSG
jgi:hypothetical protein